MIHVLLVVFAILFAYLHAYVRADDAVSPTTVASASTAAGNDVSAATAPAGSGGNSNLTVHTITVARYTNVFDPQTLKANVGDVVKFEFYPGNWSVARAEYLYPCVPYELTGTGKSGFFSGWQYTPQVGRNSGYSIPKTYFLRVNAVSPVFFYNAAPDFCKNSSFVGVLNPANDTQIFRQQEAAKAATLALAPGQAIPVGETFTPYASTSSSTTPSSASSNMKSNSLSPGAIAGIVIGSFIGLLLLGALLVYLRKRGQPKWSSAGRPGTKYAAGLTGGETPPNMAQAPQSAQNTWTQRPADDSSYHIAPLKSPPLTVRGSVGESDVNAQNAAMGTGTVSELSAYGTVSKELIPSDPPERRLPQVPTGPYELGG